MKNLNRLLFCSLLAATCLPAAAACYTVYDRANRVVYQGADAPVDMSMALHDALAARYPGTHMVFDTLTDCPSIPIARQAPVTGGTPLLTNQQMAQAMRLPYTPMAGGIALVQPRDVRMAPGVTVLPAEGSTLAARSGNETVITEYRDARGNTVEIFDRANDPTRMMGAGPAPRR